MKRFEAKRLAKLAKYMKTIKDNRFYIGAWLDGQKPIKRDVIEAAGLAEKNSLVTPEKINECGTTACLLGHAATMPEFRRRGLRMTVLNLYDDFDIHGRANGRANIGTNLCLYDEHTGQRITDDPFKAGAKFFGLSRTEVLRLFDGHYYDEVGIRGYSNVKPHHTVKMIKRILKQNGYHDLAKEI